MIDVMADFGPNNERLRRLVEAICNDEFGTDQGRTAAALGVSQSMISLAIGRAKPVGRKLKLGLSRHTGKTLDEIEGIERPGFTRWRDLPGWAEQEREARKLFRKVRPVAFSALGNLMGEKPPAVSALAIGLLASTWDQVASDDERVVAIREQAEREMDAEDEAAMEGIRARHEARERGEDVPPPMPSGGGAKRGRKPKG